MRFTRSNFWSQLLLRFKEISHGNQDFYELRQCQKTNWIEKMDRVNRPLHHFSDSLTFGVNAVLKECCNPGLE